MYVNDCIMLSVLCKSFNILLNSYVQCCNFCTNIVLFPPFQILPKQLVLYYIHVSSNSHIKKLKI
jgi:hypothetical protein